MKFKEFLIALAAIALFAMASPSAVAQQRKTSPSARQVVFDYFQETAPSLSDAPMPPGADLDDPATQTMPNGDDEAEDEEPEEEEEEEEEEEDEGPLRLFPPVGGWQFYGWIDQGYTKNKFNVVNPAAGSGNLPQTFNYRDDNYMLNQLYFVLEKETNTKDCCGCCGCGCFDWGGRIDLLYGEDYIFTQAVGLETRDFYDDPRGFNHWNSNNGNGIGGTGRMGLAMPQAYGEVAYSDLKVKVGHFYTIIGYEVVTAPDNFFYSHAYTMQYGEPFTHTGALATYQLSDRFLVNAGVVNGWDKFDAELDRAAFLGGFSWTSYDERSSLAFAIITGDEDGAEGFITGNRTMYSIVYSRQIGCNWLYVLQHDCGWQENALGPGLTAEWYGINQYLFYTINDCWKAGLRAEWFNDDDGVRIAGIPAHWTQLSLGLNYTPSANFAVRPEVRWDNVDFHDETTPANVGVYNNGNARHQFTFGIDAILQF